VRTTCAEFLQVKISGFSLLQIFMKENFCLQGWTYAIDFPSTYTKDKKWNSCVRRRRWIRYRRYKSRDVWAKVLDIFHI